MDIKIPFYVRFGKGDCVDGYVELTLTDEKYERLYNSAKKGEYYELNEDPEIRDIYEDALKIFLSDSFDTIYDIANDKYYIDKYCEENGIEPDEGFSLPTKIAEKIFINRYEFGLCYPFELQFLEDEEEDEKD